MSANLTITLKCMLCLYEALIQFYSCTSDSVQFKRIHLIGQKSRPQMDPGGGGGLVVPACSGFQ